MVMASTRAAFGELNFEIRPSPIRLFTLDILDGPIAQTSVYNLNATDLRKLRDTIDAALATEPLTALSASIQTPNVSPQNEAATV